MKLNIKWFISFYLFISFACISDTTLAQQLNSRFETLGIDDGLPHSSVYGIYQDKKGFMWFATPDGLSRYDGSTLQNFKYEAKNENDVVNNYVRDGLFEDKKGNIWYSNESGIYKWNVLTEVVERIKSFDNAEFGNSGFKCLFMENDETLVIINVIKGVFEFNTRTLTLKSYPIPFKIDYNKVVFTQSICDTKGNVWLRLLSKNEPYILFDRKTHLYSYQYIKDPPESIFFEKDRTILTYKDRVVFKSLKDKTEQVVEKKIKGKPVSFFSGYHIKDFYGREWFTSRGDGLFYYDTKNDQWHNYHHDNSILKSLPFDITTCFFIDRNNNLWIGFDGGGVAKLDLKEPKFNLFPLSVGNYPALKDYFIKCFYEDKQQNIWFGTHSSGLNIYNPKTGELKNFKHKEGDVLSLPGDIVSTITKDNKGQIWVGSSGGISRFDPIKKQFHTIKIDYNIPIFPKLNVFVFQIIMLKNGAMLAATMNGLVKIVRENGVYKGYALRNENYLISTAVDIIEMEDQTLFIALSGNGLYHLKPSGSSYTKLNMYLPKIDLRSISIDEKDKDFLWIGTGKGLVHFDTRSGKHKTWNQKNKMPNSYVYGTLEEENHNLWISTNKGLSYFNRQTNTFENYSYLDGLQSNEFNTRSFYKSSTGNFYFGGIKGFNWFKPGKKTLAVSNPVAAITKIEVNNVAFKKTLPYFSEENISVSYDLNDFNFYFAALDYTLPEANKLKYQLEGWDQDWILTYNKSVRYANLPPGNYVFKIKASNTYGVWSEVEKVLITIKAPFWQRPWFYVLLGIFILGTIVYVTFQVSQVKIRRKLRFLEREHAITSERNRISRDMHDEIGSGLTHIALLGELIQTQEEASLSVQKDVKGISTAARKLLESINEIIWALNPQNDTLESLLAYTREQMQQNFEPFKLQLFIDFPDEVPEIKLTNEQRRNLYLVIKEALNNALKHANATEITLSCSIVENMLFFDVQDNGIGFITSTSKVSNNGFKNMRKRMDDIGGEITWLNNNKGLCVHFTFSSKH
ncbi:two-component regulator propeller domain-containing protein [Pedobacter frigiditerrae]|uniref:ligand-binding sensor domain-containing protein n=1 Tax=Pedobacter frigiditerrae TaxID=2530452 RepID=UPI00292EBD8D|nr:two-component regulator propeller domain-containing protein [Pedobacter frigiditerrae]